MGTQTTRFRSWDASWTSRQRTSERELRQASRFVISYPQPWRKLSAGGNSIGASEIIAQNLAIICAALASNKKAEEILVLDLRGLSTFTDFFVICSATSEPHLKAIAGEIETKLQEEHAIRAVAIDGFPASQWIVLDYLQVVVHIFHRDKREFYSLEDLWGDAPRIGWESAASPR